MGAAWRQVRQGAAFARVLEMIRQVRALGLEVCCTLGMLTDDQVKQLEDAGLHHYNHNLDTSERHYSKIITSHSYKERIDTLEKIAASNIKTCCGGIVGIGETLEDRLLLIKSLANRQPHPDSVPLNQLERIKGTPLQQAEPVDIIEFCRLIAIARITMPRAMIRLSAGRRRMTQAEQALCIYAGANSMHVGETLLTAPNTTPNEDQQLIRKLGLTPKAANLDHLQVAPAQFLQERLDKLDAQGCRRKLSIRDAELIDFASNDYLGIASSSEIAQKIEQEFSALALQEGIRPQIGATGSRLLTGNHQYLESLEALIADYHKGESALFFNSGYNANSGLLASIGSENDAILLDSQVHAATWDGSRLSRAKTYLFRHNDMNSLEQQLSRARSRHQQLFVCVESLYSMAGDLAPLAELEMLCARYDAWLIVDEAHATGMLGPAGRGLASGFGANSRILARVYTYGKAMGCHGAAIVGSQLLRDYLISHCRSFIYTTAVPLHTLVSLRTIYGHLEQMEPVREQLRQRIRYLGQLIDQSPIPTRSTCTPIQQVLVDGAEHAVAMSERLKLAGMDVRAIRAPTVRKGQECLRICVHAFNTEQQIDQLIHALNAENLESFVA